MPPSAFKTLTVIATVSLTGFACAQGRGGGGRGAPGGAGGMGGGMDRPSMSVPNRSPSAGFSENRMRQPLGPAGRWWDDKSAAKIVGLDSRQQHRMDDVFSANRDTLLKCYKSLQHEESQLDRLARAKEPDEVQIFQQIDRIEQARGELEKANAHMLLQIRKELTPDQVAKLDEQSAQ